MPAIAHLPMYDLPEIRPAADALWRAYAAKPRPSSLAEGAPAASFAAIADRRAEVAAIDCISYALLARHRRKLAAATRILARTAQSPTLPFVTARSRSAATVGRLRDALAACLADPALAGSREALLLAGMTPADEADYGILQEYETRAEGLGYPLLA